VIYKFSGFEWDKSKAEKNIKKHSLDFYDAEQVFRDENAKTIDSPQKGEERYKTIGMCNGRLVTVVHTPRDTACRIISMRHSWKKERMVYDLSKKIF